MKLPKPDQEDLELTDPPESATESYQEGLRILASLIARRHLVRLARKGPVSHGSDCPEKGKTSENLS
jgi:hypothetical protein